MFYCIIEQLKSISSARVITKESTLYLFYPDPARALKMPQQTYLPTGLEGVVTCPVAAQPPLLHVDWTKDGEPLDLSMVIINSFLLHDQIQISTYRFIISLHDFMG